MAEGKDDLNLSTECNDQRQRERQPARVNLGGHAVKQVPKPVDHDDPEDGGELEEASSRSKPAVPCPTTTLMDEPRPATPENPCPTTVLVAHAKDRKKPIPMSKLSEDFGQDFMSTCQAIEGRLFSLDSTYAIFSEAEIKQLSETGRQFSENQILISFVGHLNVGKSTLLNALLGARLLPISKAAETSIMVHIHHCAGDSCLDPKATSDQHPKLLLVKAKQVRSEEVVGVTEIYQKLETLNRDVRNGAKGNEEVYILKTKVPLLANTPSNWQVVLVDTPGTGDFNSRVAAVAEGAVRSSSAYVFIITYSELQNAENANFIKFLHEHDQGVFEDRRLIIAVAQFDRTIQLDDTNEEITVEDVREKVHQLVSEACPDVTISCDDVLPLSGLWAYSARMLMSHPNGPEHSKYRRNAESYLRQYQSLPGGQGESQSSSLTSRNDDELVEQLLDVSRFASLEARIHNVMKSCRKVWVSKMKGDYERYLKQADDRLSKQVESESGQCNKQKEECLRVQKCLGEIDDERHDLEEIMESRLYKSLDQRCPENQEVAKSVQKGKDFVLDEIKFFREQCVKKVKDRRITFGQVELDEDVKTFLKKIAIGLEELLTSTGWFRSLNNVLSRRTAEMGESIGRMVGKVEQLCATLGQEMTFESSHSADECSPTALVSTSMAAQVRQRSTSPTGSTSTTSTATPCSSTTSGPPAALVSTSMEAQVRQRSTSPTGSTSTTSTATPCSSTTSAKASDEEKDSSEPQYHIAPNLQSIEEEMKCLLDEPPPWARLAEAFRSVMCILLPCFQSGDLDSDSFRSWNRELEANMESLERHLKEKCDAHFTNIRHHILQYFCDLYCSETKDCLKHFDKEYKAKIGDGRRQLQQLNESLVSTERKIKDLQQLCGHLKKLTSHLHTEADHYISNIAE